MQSVTVTELTSATGGTARGIEPAAVIDGVSLDTRSLRPGEVFWAVRGRRHDGHSFVEDAFRRGAAACVVSSEYAQRTRAAGGPTIVVEETLAALSDFARWYRQRSDALIIAVTGSVGKTTTREMLHAALSAGFRGTRSPHNFNNHYGVPLSLLGIAADDEFAVLELGASRVGEIGELAQVAAPEIGAVTAVAPAHLEEFGSEEEILRAKGELIETLPASGFAVLGGDDPQVRRLAERAACPVLLVGLEKHNRVRGTDVEVQNDRIAFRVDGQHYEVSACGRHHLTAALIAVAVASEVGMPGGAIAGGLRSFVPPAGRCRPERIGQWTVIDDTYNASPASMAAACRLLSEWNTAGPISGRAAGRRRAHVTPRRILVAGDMLELGESAERHHYQLGCLTAESGLDCLIVHGEHADTVVAGALDAGMPAWSVAGCRDFDAMLAVLDCWLEPGDVVLVKGSRALRMENVIDWLRLRAELSDFADHEARTVQRETPVAV